MLKQFNLILLVGCLSFVFSCVQAANIPDSSHHNANPFVEIHHLPGFSGSKMPDPGQFQTRLDVTIANEFHQDAKSNETLLLDYERTTLDLGFRYGINKSYSLGLNIPYVFNRGGFLDSWIENWHDLFSLPQGGRDQAPENEFTIRYQTPSQSFVIDEKDSGIGDLSFYLQGQLIDTKDRRLTAIASLKLPTGDEQQLFGSGGYGLSLSAHASQQFSQSWTGFGSLGLTYLEQGKVFNLQQKDLVGSAVLGLAWHSNSQLSLSGQIDVNTKIYDDSDLDAVSGQGGALHLAVHYALAEHAVIEFGFTEDLINKDAVPDFAIRLGIAF